MSAAGGNAANAKVSVIKELLRNKYLYLLTVPGILFVIVFNYLPLLGLVIAFQDFNAIKGVFGSDFIGFKNFEFFFQSNDWIRVTVNTLYLNLLFIVFGTIAAIAIAIMLSEIRSKWFARVSQSVVILPHFISWTVVSMFAVTLFSSEGLLNRLMAAMGFDGISFYSTPGVWPVILVLLNIWHGAGFASIVYLATIAGINTDIYESASIDGATRWQKIWHITLPLLKNTVILLTLLKLGSIFYGDFGMIYALIGTNPILYPTTDVIDTYVYRALMQLGDIGMASAIGFFQSIVGFALVVSANWLAKKFSAESAIF
jgi:putative aldouronate transport system permease protein